MTVHTIKQDSTTLHTVDVPDSSEYTRPAVDSASTTALRRGSDVLFRVNNTDGLGTTKTIGGKTFYSKYRTIHFESTYSAIKMVPHSTFYRFGWNTTAYDARGNAHGGTTTDSQQITVPGHSGTFPINAVFFAGLTNQNPDRFTFSVTPNGSGDGENDLGANAWTNYNFILTGNGETLTFDGSRLQVHGAPGAEWDHEQWNLTSGHPDPLTNTERATMASLITAGSTYSLKIQRK